MANTIAYWDTQAVFPKGILIRGAMPQNGGLSFAIIRTHAQSGFEKPKPARRKPGHLSQTGPRFFFRASIVLIFKEIANFGG